MSPTATTSNPTARPGRMTADERRDAIVAAAVEEFATGGLVGASTEAIAREAGVSQPYVFQLFGTKKGLFLAVVRRCFGRTRLAFEDAAGNYVPDQNPDCNTVLQAIGQEYMRLLANRTNLLVQLQAYAACADPDVRAVVREEFAALHRRVRELSGASAEELQDFFAHGMLLNVAAAFEVGTSTDKHWLLENLEGGA
ncbi:MAG TPA: TetR/AcrR family transcriptional regulator [Candidatus Limnocylindrales bacterium]